MRNTLQYPVKSEEVLDAITRAAQSTTDAIGGVDGYALHQAAVFLQMNRAAFEEFLKKK